MEQRFSGNILRKVKEQTSPVPTLGEIGINQFAPYLMNRIAARWNVNMVEALKAHDVTTSQMRALAILSLASSVTINELSVYTVIEQSTMSRTLDSLEEQGLIRRQPRPEDMRIRDVSITEEGRVAFESVWPTMYELFQQLFDGVEEDDYRVFISILHRILRNVRKHDI
ncbi:MAG TPA: MarR family transcriptional regulator [Magnetospirillaceae bacterium]|jgi:DNA-binding MarR family transcriptional regulator